MKTVRIVRGENSIPDGIVGVKLADGVLLSVTVMTNGKSNCN